MTSEQKFKAAVNVIRNLPKNGAFQPSVELQLKFYSYFKQATEGPNTKPKPSFWDLPGQAKWSAWKKLGNLPKEEAMECYIEQLKSIVETMSYNADVESFLGSLGSFYDSVPAEDVDLVLGPVIEKVKMEAMSRNSSPGRPATNGNAHITAEEPSKKSTESTSHNSPAKSNTPDISSVNTHNNLPCPIVDSDDDEFTDPMTTPQLERKFVTKNAFPATTSTSSLDANSGSYHVLQKTVRQLQKAVEQLQKDIDLVNRSLETVKENKRVSRKFESKSPAQLLWNTSPAFTAFIVVWPVAVYILMPYLKKNSPK